MRCSSLRALAERVVSLPLAHNVNPLEPAPRALVPRSPAAIARVSNRDLVLAVLRTTATKREARQYVAKYAHGDAQYSKGGRKLGGGGPRIALVRIPADLPRTDPAASKALGQTLAQLSALGARPLILLDATPAAQAVLQNGVQRYSAERAQVAAMAAAWSVLIGGNAVPLTIPFAWQPHTSNATLDVANLVEQQLKAATVPILCPFAFDPASAETTFCDGPQAAAAIVRDLRNRVMVDKVVFVDEVGGIPSVRRKLAAHLFINLLQEYGEVSAELRAPAITEADGGGSSSSSSSDSMANKNARHIANLDAMNAILSALTPSTTGIITSPRAAADTALHRNPILYNLLTDRPLCSPSLPMELAQTQLETTILRRGFPVRVVRPAPQFNLRTAAKAGELSLTKLQTLINKSFGRTIDMDHYMDRTGDRVAAIIVVGNYEGAAIITWEYTPSGRPVAYLDKLAVHPSAQGAAGVADVLLILMIRRLFSKEIVWRSRANNPVNRWYFERSRGFLRVPNTQWIMFWNTASDTPPLADYVEVCRSIATSFKD